MKKLILIIPILFIFIHLMYANFGQGIWSQSLSTSLGVWQDCIVINSTNTNIMYAGTAGAGVYKTTNGGLNWVQVNNGLGNLIVQSMGISKSNPDIIMVGTTNTGSSPGVYKTTDGGANWTLKNNGITEPILPQAIAIHPTNPNVAYTVIFTGGANAINGVYKTTDGGDNWFVANTGITIAYKNFLSIVINPLNTNVVYIGSSFNVSPQSGPQKIYKSVDAGATWVDMSTGLPQLSGDINPVRSMSMSTVDTATILAGLFQNTTTGGAFLTTNGGGSWTKIHTGLPSVAGNNIRSALIRPGTTTEFYVGFDAGATSGVWRTTNKGALWTNFSGGALQNSAVVRVLNFRTTPDSTVYAGVAGAAGMGVYEYTHIPVGITINNGNIPKEFALYQNYPNPFNPATFIKYDIPKQAFVTLDVYDASGRVVNTLVNETKTAGSYEVDFDAANLASGVYFFKLTAGEFSDTKKMILVR